MASKLYPDAYAERSEVVHAGFVNAPPAAYGAIGQPQTQTQSPMIVLPYQSQPSLYPAPDSSLYPAQMQQQNRIPVYAPVMRSVCVLLAPLYFRTYWLILYFILISFPWALFLFSFVSGTLAGSFGAIAACGVGIPLVALFAYSWRALAHLDVWLTKTFCPPADLTETVIMRHITVNRNPGFGSWLKANLLHPLTWSSVLYSLFWRPLWSTFTFATVLTLLSVSLAMLAKPFLGAVDLDPFENCKTCQWFLQDHSAYVVMIIVAVVLLYVLCALVHGLASVERRMSWWALGQRTISAQDYASYTVVPVTLNGAPNTTDSMTSVAKIVDPADKYQSATMARYALPATPVLPYARRRSNCARSLCFCCCCCTFLAIFVCGAAAGLLAARCATAARSEQESEYRLNTTAPGVSSLLVDASGIAWGAAIAVEGVGNATDQIIIKATLSYVQGSGVPDFLDHLTSDASADGSLYLSSAGIGLWPMVRHCPTLKLRAFLPPSFVNRPQLTFATSNSRVTVNNLPSPVLDTLSVLKLTTSNAEVRFDAAFGPTTAAVEVQTSNAAIKGTNVTAARLDATTSNGKIRFDILRTTDLSLETSNADVQLGTVVAPNSISSSIRVLTSNADIEVQAIRLANDSRSAIGLTTSNADVEATLFGFEGNFTLFAPNGDADLENLQWRVVQYTTNTKSEKTGYVRTQHGQNTISLRTSNADAELTLYA